MFSMQAPGDLQSKLNFYNAQVEFLNSDKKSNWMEVSFEEALRCPDNEWGPYWIHIK
jgi:hypothetical protein